MASYWYRYYDVITAQGGVNVIGEWERSGPGRVSVKLMEFPFQRKTPKGTWVGYNDVPYQRWFVRDKAVKKFAHPTKELAMEAFVKRKDRQRAILRSQLDRASKAADIGRWRLQNGIDKTPELVL